jgi:hypothetical protein
MPYPAADERRTHPRALTAALAEIIDRNGVSHTCVLEDISQSGVLCHSGVEFRNDDLVQLRIGTVKRVAVVKHCEESGYGFYIGLQFIGEKWPGEIKLPIHGMKT